MRGREQDCPMGALWGTWSCTFLRLVQAEGFKRQTILIFYSSCACPGIWMGDVLQKVPQVQVWGVAWAWITDWCTIDLLALEVGKWSLFPGWGKKLRKSTCCLFWMIISERVWESAPAVFQSTYPCWGRSSYVLKYTVEIWTYPLLALWKMSDLVKC